MVITKSKLVIGATAVMVAAVTLTGTGIHLSKGLALLKESPKDLVDEVWHIINNNYVDGTFNQVDWKQVRQDYVKDYPDQQDAYKNIREMLKKLGDPYTRFMDPEEFKNMQIDTSGELTGVGLQLAQDEETKKLVVIAPIEDTPAFKAGIQAKDVILKINDKTTEGMDTNQAVSLIRGPANSTVTLTIGRTTQQNQIKTMDFTLKRTRIEIHPVHFAYHPDQLNGVGYIRLNQFSANAVSEMRKAIQDLEKNNVTGYILDLRSNPGGLLYASVEIAQMWLNDSTIVSTVYRQGERDRQVANHQALTNKPLVILVDGGSASASEILSGALQDNKRAVLVGAKTFGKGLVQSVRGLSDGSGLAVTIAKYYTPSGRDINHAGIEPNYKIELTDSQRQMLRKDHTKIGTPNDPQYAKALEVLKQEIATGSRSVVNK